MKRRCVDLGHELSEGRFDEGSVWMRNTTDRTDCEAGPSRSRDFEAQRPMRSVQETAEECEACQRRRGVRGDDPLSWNGSKKNQPSTPSRRRPPRKPGAVRQALTPTIPLLALLSTVFAAPPPTRVADRPRLHTASSTPSTAGRLARRGGRYWNAADALPTNVPTHVSVIAETALPYVLTQNDEGKWHKVDDAWYLYGRQAGSYAAMHADEGDADAMPTDSSNASPSSATWAVEEALPNGWGQNSSRTSLYKVPLIVVASIILAIGIVVGIVYITFARRRANRQAKRRAERQRRRALAAAGLNEDDINGSTVEAAMRDKLAELEQQHRSRERTDQKSSAVRRKVRKWNRRLRRRKGTAEEAPDLEDAESEKSIEPIPEVITSTLRRRSTESIRSRTAHSVRSSSSSETPVPLIEDAPADQARTPEPEQPTTISYFPPAYRPASVRSYQMSDPAPSAGPSRRTASAAINEDGPSLSRSPMEKTHASGYYPAPATEDSEAAMAVASRIDWKARMIVSDEGINEEVIRLRHIATDDKTVLERLRLGASAPPASSLEALNEDGPSAPDVEVDEYGFERVMNDPDDPEDGTPPSQSEAVEAVHPALPAPPRPLAARFLTSLEPGSATDEHCLLPSAPPASNPDSAPSAPPAAEDGDSAIMPSAPPLPDDDEGAEGDEIGMASQANPNGRLPTSRETTADVRATIESGEGGVGSGEPIVGMPVYLPRYEP